jgi:hypothetical protein
MPGAAGTAGHPTTQGTMLCGLNAVGLLNLDLAADFHEILRGNVEQVHCPDRVAKHQHEQAQPDAHQPAALFGADHGVPAAEIDCVFEIDRTPMIFRLPQGGGNVRHLNKADRSDDGE